MRDGFIKVAAGTPKLQVADCRYNAEQIFFLMRKADEQGVRVLCLPELCITGATCGDLFFQDTLLRGAEEALATILEATKNLDMVTAVGLPLRCQWDGKLYNCAALIQKGEILGLVPKSHFPASSELQQSRWFASGAGVDFSVTVCGQRTSLSSKGLFFCQSMPNLILGWRSARISGPRSRRPTRWSGAGPPSSSTPPPPARAWARPTTAALWSPASPAVWCAAMSLPAPARASPPPTWSSADTT